MDFEDEPMEIDLSGNSVRHSDAMDISYIELNETWHDVKVKEEPFETIKEEINENIFDYEIPKPSTPTVIKHFTVQRKDHKSLSNTALSVIVTIVSLGTLLMYHIMKFECSQELDLEVLKKSLDKNIIGQSQAIEHIIKSLEDKSNSKLLLIYGGTGVGKTLVTSLILKNLHHYANIYHYTMPSFSYTFSADSMLGLNFCPFSIIVVDDLNSTDMQVKEHIKKVIEKSENLSKNITVILVFNCDNMSDQYVKKCDYTFSTDLHKAFTDIKALKRYIKFNSLSEEHLRTCVERELGGKNLSDEEIENIIKNFNVSVDGCKGVYTKIKSMNIN